MDVINKVRNKSDTLDLCVVRISKDGILKNSKPCKTCIKFIEKSKIKIKNIYYSNSKGEIIKSNLNDLNKDDLITTSGLRRRNIKKS